jgi:hypothetical protein
MSEQYDENAPLTAGFLTQVFATFQKQLDAKLDERFSSIDERFTALRNEMLEQIEDSETRLLKEFRKWAVRIESAGRVYEARSFGLDQRVTVLEERVNELEEPRGKN